MSKCTDFVQVLFIPFWQLFYVEKHILTMGGGCAFCVNSYTDPRMRFATLFFCVSFFLLLSASLAHAQSAQTGIAVPVIVNDENPPDGSIVCTGKGSYILCNDTYSTAIF